MPFFGRCVLFADLANLVGKLLFEVGVCRQEEVCQLFDDGLYVGPVGDLVDQVQCLFFDDQVVGG